MPTPRRRSHDEARRAATPAVLLASLCAQPGIACHDRAVPGAATPSVLRLPFDAVPADPRDADPRDADADANDGSFVAKSLAPEPGSNRCGLVNPPLSVCPDTAVIR